LAVKKIKAETAKQCFAKAGFGESGVGDNFEENIAVIFNLCGGKELSCDIKNFVRSEKRKEEEKKQPENRIFQRKFVHMNRPFIVQ
jgi:hypothetical protein